MPWVVIGIYLFGAGCGDGGTQASSMGSLTLYSYSLTSLLSTWCSNKKVGPWHDYLFGERVYILLSLSSKSVLAWQVFAGPLGPV